MRYGMARVFPVPAPARIRPGPSSFLGTGGWENFHPRNELVRGHRVEVDLKKKERLFVRHKEKVRDVDGGVANRIELVIDIIKEKTVRGPMGRQDVRRKHEGLNHGVHFVPGLPLSRRSPGTRERHPRSGWIGPGPEDRAVGNLRGSKWQQFFMVLPRNRNCQENSVGVDADWRVAVIFEVNIDGDN